MSDKTCLGTGPEKGDYFLSFLDKAAVNRSIEDGAFLQGKLWSWTSVSDWWFLQNLDPFEKAHSRTSTRVATPKQIASVKNTPKKFCKWDILVATMVYKYSWTDRVPFDHWLEETLSLNVYLVQKYNRNTTHPAEQLCFAGAEIALIITSLSSREAFFIPGEWPVLLWMIPQNICWGLCSTCLSLFALRCLIPEVSPNWNIKRPFLL